MNAKEIISAHAKRIGAIGGRSRSKAKLKAVRKNARLGGRPKKDAVHGSPLLVKSKKGEL